MYGYVIFSPYISIFLKFALKCSELYRIIYIASL